MSKLVSIIIPTFNPDKHFFIQALNSIIKQTYDNLEIIIVDDSTDIDKTKFIEEYAKKDHRIHFVHNDIRMGISESLNYGIRISRGEYVLRMDDDDISIHDRVKAQVEYMERHREVDILGGQALFFGKRKGIYRVPLENDDIKSNLLIHNPFIHPSIAFRRSSIERYNLKYKTCRQAEDYLLWSRSFIDFPDIIYANMNKVLIKYRIHALQLTSSQRTDINESHGQIWNSILEHYKIHLSKQELDVYKDALNGTRILKLKELIFLDHLFEELKVNNEHLKIVSPIYLNRLLNKYFKTICFHQYYYKGNGALEQLVRYPLKQKIIKIWYKKPFSYTHILTNGLVTFIKKFREK